MSVEWSKLYIWQAIHLNSCVMNAAQYYQVLSEDWIFINETKQSKPHKTYHQKNIVAAHENHLLLEYRYDIIMSIYGVIEKSMTGWKIQYCDWECVVRALYIFNKIIINFNIQI